MISQKQGFASPLSKSAQTHQGSSAGSSPDQRRFTGNNGLSATRRSNANMSPVQRSSHGEGSTSTRTSSASMATSVRSGVPLCGAVPKNADERHWTRPATPTSSSSSPDKSLRPLVKTQEVPNGVKELHGEEPRIPRKRQRPTEEQPSTSVVNNRNSGHSDDKGGVGGSSRPTCRSSPPHVNVPNTPPSTAASREGSCKPTVSHSAALAYCSKLGLSPSATARRCSSPRPCSTVPSPMQQSSGTSPRQELSTSPRQESHGISPRPLFNGSRKRILDSSVGCSESSITVPAAKRRNQTNELQERPRGVPQVYTRASSRFLSSGHEAASAVPKLGLVATEEGKNLLASDICKKSHIPVYSNKVSTKRRSSSHPSSRHLSCQKRHSAAKDSSDESQCSLQLDADDYRLNDLFQDYNQPRFERDPDMVQAVMNTLDPPTIASSVGGPTLQAPQPEATAEAEERKETSCQVLRQITKKFKFHIFKTWERRKRRMKIDSGPTTNLVNEFGAILKPAPEGEKYRVVLRVPKNNVLVCNMRRGKTFFRFTFLDVLLLILVPEDEGWYYVKKLLLFGERRGRPLFDLLYSLINGSDADRPAAAFGIAVPELDEVEPVWRFVFDNWNFDSRTLKASSNMPELLPLMELPLPNNEGSQTVDIEDFSSYRRSALDGDPATGRMDKSSRNSSMWKEDNWTYITSDIFTEGISKCGLPNVLWVEVQNIRRAFFNLKSMRNCNLYSADYGLRRRTAVNLRAEGYINKHRRHLALRRHSGSPEQIDFPLDEEDSEEHDDPWVDLCYASSEGLFDKRSLYPNSVLQVMYHDEHDIFQQRENFVLFEPELIQQLLCQMIRVPIQEEVDTAEGMLEVQQVVMADEKIRKWMRDPIILSEMKNTARHFNKEQEKITMFDLFIRDGSLMEESSERDPMKNVDKRGSDLWAQDSESYIANTYLQEGGPGDLLCDITEETLSEVAPTIFWNLTIHSDFKVGETLLGWTSGKTAGQRKKRPSRISSRSTRADYIDNIAELLRSIAERAKSRERQKRKEKDQEGMRRRRATLEAVELENAKKVYRIVQANYFERSWKNVIHIVAEKVHVPCLTANAGCMEHIRAAMEPLVGFVDFVLDMEIRCKPYATEDEAPLAVLLLKRLHDVSNKISRDLKTKDEESQHDILFQGSLWESGLISTLIDHVRETCQKSFGVDPRVPCCFQSQLQRIQDGGNETQREKCSRMLDGLDSLEGHKEEEVASPSAQILVEHPLEASVVDQERSSRTSPRNSSQGGSGSQHYSAKREDGVAARTPEKDESEDVHPVVRLLAMDGTVNGFCSRKSRLREKSDVVRYYVDCNGFFKELQNDSISKASRRHREIIWKECCLNAWDAPVLLVQNEKGRAVVAAHDISQFAYVCEYRGNLLNSCEASERDREYDKRQLGSYMFHFNNPLTGSTFVLDSTKEDASYGYARLINHSRKKPNLKSTVVVLNHPSSANVARPHLIFFATKHIFRGTELLIDYGETNPDVLKANPWLTDC